MRQLQEQTTSYSSQFIKRQQISHAALSFIRRLESQIEEQKPLLKEAGLSPYIESHNHEGWGVKLHEGVVSNAVLGAIIKNIPHLSLYSRSKLKATFSPNRPTHINLFSHPSLLLEFEEKLDHLRETERIGAITWLRTAEIHNRLGYSQENYSDVPKVLRLSATPDIAKSQPYTLFKNPHTFGDLSLLEASLAHLTNTPLPNKLIGHIVSDTWDRQYSEGYKASGDTSMAEHQANHKRGISHISTFNFCCNYFKLKAFRVAADQITLTDEARSLINQYPAEDASRGEF
jgi:hypothetical protein